MIFQEKDIEFGRLDWKSFEELCFDLLLKYQYHSLTWREGGQDKGRDIEALYTVINSIVGSYQEKWFVECKHLKKGIGVSDISDKIEWAKIDQADQFIIITSSHLTQAARDWLDKQKERLPFRVHRLEGKLLKQRLMQFPELILKYFFDDKTSAVSEMLKSWVLYDILPNAKSLYNTLKKADLDKLRPEHLVFLLYCQNRLSDELENFCTEEERDEIPSAMLVPFIIAAKTTDLPILEANSQIKFRVERNFLGQMFVETPNTDHKHFYLRNVYRGKYIFEIFVIKQNQSINFEISFRKRHRGDNFL